MNGLRILTLILLIVGGLNWGLVRLFDFNLVNAIFGGIPWLERLIYILVGLSAVVQLASPDTWRRGRDHATITRP